MDIFLFVNCIYINAIFVVAIQLYCNETTQNCLCMDEPNYSVPKRILCEILIFLKPQNRFSLWKNAIHQLILFTSFTNTNDIRWLLIYHFFYSAKKKMYTIYKVWLNKVWRLNLSETLNYSKYFLFNFAMIKLYSTLPWKRWISTFWRNSHMPGMY